MNDRATRPAVCTGYSEALPCWPPYNYCRRKNQAWLTRWEELQSCDTHVSVHDTCSFQIRNSTILSEHQSQPRTAKLASLRIYAQGCALYGWKLAPLPYSCCARFVLDKNYLKMFPPYRGPYWTTPLLYFNSNAAFASLATEPCVSSVHEKWSYKIGVTSSLLSQRVIINNSK